MKHPTHYMFDPTSNFGLKVAAIFVLGAAFLVLAALLAALPFWALWNTMLPRLFGFPHITLLEALGIIVMAKLLNGGHFKFSTGE